MILGRVLTWIIERYDGCGGIKEFLAATAAVFVAILAMIEWCVEWPALWAWKKARR